MTTFDFKAHWNQIKGGLRQRYGVLTDDDVAFVEGKSEELLGRLQEKLGLGEDELQRIFAELEEETSGGVRGKVDEFKSKAAGVFDDLKHQANGYMEDAKAAAALKAEEMKGQAGEVVAQAKLRARTLHEDAEEYVRHQPRQALLTALAAGFVAGLLLRR